MKRLYVLRWVSLSIAATGLRRWSEVMTYIGAGVSIYLAEGEAVIAYDEVNWLQPSVLIVGGEARVRVLKQERLQRQSLFRCWGELNR